MRLLVLINLCWFTLSLSAQQPQAETIKVTKVQQVIKAAYDNTQYKLIGVDRFGNPKETAIRSFELRYSINGHTYMFVSYSGALTDEMIGNMNALKKDQKIFFSKIKAQEDNGDLVDLPDLQEIHIVSHHKQLKIISHHKKKE